MLRSQTSTKFKQQKQRKIDKDLVPGNLSGESGLFLLNKPLIVVTPGERVRKRLAGSLQNLPPAHQSLFTKPILGWSGDLRFKSSPYPISQEVGLCSQYLQKRPTSTTRSKHIQMRKKRRWDNLIEIDGERNPSLGRRLERGRRRPWRRWEERSKRGIRGRRGGFCGGEEMEVAEKAVRPFAGVAGGGGAIIVHSWERVPYEEMESGGVVSRVVVVVFRSRRRNC